MDESNRTKKKKKSKKRNRTRVSPSSEDDEGRSDHKYFEMNPVRSHDNNLEPHKQDITGIGDVVHDATYNSICPKHTHGRRKIRQSVGEDGMERAQCEGLGLDVDWVGEDVVDCAIPTKPVVSIPNDRWLIDYFARIDDRGVDVDDVKKLIDDGADINGVDRYGQTVLHEAARDFPLGVGRFLLEQGADVNKSDAYGRTPLHVAAAVNCPQMVNLLIEFKADKEARTTDETQTPVHYAAKNDACDSLKALAKCGCAIKNVVDYKGRTPIHVAVEFNRSESARILMSLGAPVGVSDNQGQKAITLMIAKMPQIAVDALDEFRSKDRVNRTQCVNLKHITHDPYDSNDSHSQSPLLVAVNHQQYQILMHPCFQRLIDVMWKKFGRRGAWIYLILNFLYIVVWTIIGVSVGYDQQEGYNTTGDWWRKGLIVVAILCTIWKIFRDLLVYHRSVIRHQKWILWRKGEIEKDIIFAHPRFPEENKFLDREMETLKDEKEVYFRDMWNMFDFLYYVFLVASIITLLYDVFFHSELLAKWHVRILCVTIFILWLRLLKYARAFVIIGPFIVMLGHMMKDCLRFLFLYLEFYIPYACAFWMIFGGDKRAEANINDSSRNETIRVSGYETPVRMLFSVFRLTLVDEYDFDAMYLVDSVMATILVWSWLALSAVVFLNIFIALLSDTFQRIYDNAHANCVMQRAITILSIWEGMSKRNKKSFLKFISENCSPIKDYYEDDLTESSEDDLKKVTMQIKDQLEDINGIHEMIREIKTQQELMISTVSTFKHDLKSVKKMLKELTGRHHVTAVDEV